MYSLVLAMAMTGAGDVPAWGGCCGGGCWGCYGCSGGCWGGKGCHGCHGGHGCHGCHGGFGCFGGKGCHGCHGCHGCYGSCYGWSCCGGCYGSCYGSCYTSSCCGSVSYGDCYGSAVAPMAPVSPMPPAGTKPAEPIKAPKTGEKGAMVPAPATIVVSLPADARLTIDEAATTTTSERRVFVSPELAPGREFHYTLKAEWVRDGKTVMVSKQVAVSAGNETAVNIDAEEAVEVASR